MDGGALQVRRNDGQSITHGRQIGQRHQRRLAAVEHVDELQARQAFGDGADLRQRFRRFHEKHVGARLQVTLGARDSRIKPFDGDSVRARNDQRVGVAQCLPRDVDLAAHFLDVDQALVVQVAAALGKRLVFDMESSHARALHDAYRALNIGGPTKARVRVRDDRQPACIHDLFHAVHHFGKAEQANVRIARRARNGAAAGVHGVESCHGHQPRGHAVIGAGRHHDVIGQVLAQQGAGFQRGIHAGSWKRDRCVHDRLAGLECPIYGMLIIST
ncbi:hypothetical protein D3C72_1009860 [compost metagenome]